MTYKISVDCAACALKMEDAAKKVDGVKSANINFMTQKMKLEFDENANKNEVIKKVEKTCKKIDSDFDIYI